MPETTEQPKLTTPTLHLNGSSYADLMEPLNAAYQALGDAQQALERCWPNARDYYPQGPTAAGQANIQHNKRFKAISDIMSEIDAMREAVQDQQDERDRLKAQR